MTDTQTEAKKLTADEFSRQVLEDKPRVAIFDCDGTLWSGDSGYGFMVWSLEQGLVSRSTSDWIDARYRSYCAGDIDEETICGEMVQMYAGLHERELQSAAAEYVRSFVLPRVFSEMAMLVEDLTKAGTELWAVSSTNRWVVTEGVRAFGIPEERVLAADVIVVAGNITSTIKEVPTDEGKATALKRVGLNRPDVVFGNSLHDLAMLDLAAKAFPVNPSPGLLEAAGGRGWGYFRPAAAEVARTVVSGE